MTERSERLPAGAVDSMEREFRTKVPEIFAEQLVFALIFGGFGKGYGGPGHDIDMLVVVTAATASRVSEFREWYMDLHRRFGLPPDREYPGEIVALEDLERRMGLLERRRMRPVVETLYEYEAILWTDALSEPKKGLVHGSASGREVCHGLFERALRLNARWRREMADMRPEPPEELAGLDLRRLFKGYVRYLKGPGI